MDRNDAINSNLPPYLIALIEISSGMRWPSLCIPKAIIPLLRIMYLSGQFSSSFTDFSKDAVWVLRSCTGNNLRIDFPMSSSCVHSKISSHFGFITVTFWSAPHMIIATGAETTIKSARSNCRSLSNSAETRA